MSVFVRCRSFVTTVLSMAAFACFLPFHLSASTVQVYPTGGTPCVAGVTTTFNSISAAVAGVVANSTIYICPGTYAEQVVITKKLTLIGVSGNGLAGSSASGSNNPVVVPPSGGVVANTTDLYPGGGTPGEPTAAQILVQTPSGSLSTPIKVSISNIAVDGTNNGDANCGVDLVGIYYQNASGTIDHVTARYQELPPGYFGCQGGLAIYVQSGYGSGGTATVVIENSSVHDYDKNGITVDGSGTVATVDDNYVVGIGATSLTAQNGIQMSDGARGSIENNIVTDDVYINPSDCDGPTVNGYTPPVCYSSTGILLYDSGGTQSTPVTISGNTVSNTQGAIVAVTDGNETADYNNLSSNKITSTPALSPTGVGPIPLDSIDLCSDNNTATSNTVLYSSASGVHLDSSCTEPGGSASGVNSTATSNTINEACAGVLLGNSGGVQSGTITYNVVETTATGDTCPVGNGGSSVLGKGEPGVKASAKAMPQPRHR
jgi:hypothetical protein